MNRDMLKKIGIIILSIFAVIYLSFLLLPFILNPILNSKKDSITDEIKKSSGIEIKLKNMQVVTTPKLTAGLKIQKIEGFLPNKDKFIESDNFQIKLSILPILVRNIEIDIVSADNLNLDLKVQKDGKFLIEKYLEENAKPQEPAETTRPFIKLSNHLPNIIINKHNINFIDSQTNKKYSLQGQDTSITNFILDKKIKINSQGQLILDGRKQFSYNVKVFNKIMPDVQLNDLVFNPQPTEEKKEEFAFNIIEIFNTIYKNQLNADLKSDIKIHGTADDAKLNGFLNIDNLYIAVDNQKLPLSNIDIIFKNNKINIDSNLYSAANELTKIIGDIKTGKKPAIDMNVKSNAKLSNLCRLIDSVASSFGINDLETLSATGVINADFNIKSNMKKIESSGYLKIPSGSLKYGLYNISLDNINADVSLDNNMVNIKDAGFNIQGQPITIHGTIKQDATASLYILADKLSIKNLLVSMGQAALLKDNNFNSGTITLYASLLGRLNAIVPKADISIENVNIKNIPSATTVILPVSKINIFAEKKTFKGTASANNFKAINPGATVSIPYTTATIEEKAITVNPANVVIDKIRFSVSGVIKNYLTEKMILDFKTVGDLNSNLNGYFYPISQNLDLTYSIPAICALQIPGFNDATIKVKGNTTITGSTINPILKGNFNIPLISIPEMLVKILDMTLSLNGPMFVGNGKIEKLVSGGITAEKLYADFVMKNEMLYLKNITGNSFSGKVGGKVDYNMNTTKTVVDFYGKNMDATSAIEGASGIKNALSGTLDFNTKVSLQGIEYEDMIKSLKGTFSFEINDGALGRIGRLENFLNAQNIITNNILRAAISNIGAITTIKDTATFKYIKGNMIFKNGWAEISSIQTCGPTMAYHVNGKYNILNGTTNVIVLGRLSSNVVALLGPLGDLSVDKLTSYIPKFGTLTSIIIKSMTTDPANENTALIPELSSGQKSYKDFKVVFNGGIESQSSVKSFKWLTKTDTSAIDFKSTVKDVKKQITDLKKESIEFKNSTITDTKNKINEQKEKIKNSKEELKNLFKF